MLLLLLQLRLDLVLFILTPSLPPDESARALLSENNSNNTDSKNGGFVNNLLVCCTRFIQRPRGETCGKIWVRMAGKRVQRAGAEQRGEDGGKECASGSAWH